MKHLYVPFLAGGVLLLATAAQAQAPGKLGLAGSRSLSQYAITTAPSGASDLRGGGPANDDCGSVTPQALAVGGSLNFSGNNTGATADGDYAPGSELDGLGIPSVWHAFTTTECADVTVSYCGSDAVFAQNAWVILSSDCPASDNSLVFNSNWETSSCVDGNITISYDLLPAGTYYLPVLSDPVEGIIGNYTINVSAAPCPTPPANDQCSGAITLTSSASCNPVPFTTDGATQDLDPITCGGFTSANAFDVFFSFVCTSTTQTIGVVGYNGADALIELFSGSCSSLVSLACEDSTFPLSEDETTSENLVAQGLTVGATYYVRVYDWGHFSADHNFEICVVEGSGTNVGIAENDLDAAWSIYPNPGAGVFTIRYAGESTLADIEVLDVAGRIVRTERVALAQGTNHALDLGTLDAGNYLVRVTAGGVRSVRPLIVE